MAMHACSIIDEVHNFMIQEQFIFIHDAILESVTCGDTQISATNLRVAITKMRKSNGFQYQMKVL